MDFVLVLHENPPIARMGNIWYGFEGKSVSMKDWWLLRIML